MNEIVLANNSKMFMVLVNLIFVPMVLFDQLSDSVSMKMECCSTVVNTSNS